jgi:colicin import membrane protein
MQVTTPEVAPAKPKPTSLKVMMPDQLQLQKDAESKKELVAAIEIDSPEMYQHAATELMSIKDKIDELEKARTSLVGPLNQVVTQINSMYRQPRETLMSAEKLLKASMLTFQQAEEKKRQEEEAKAREAQRIEQERIANEARALREAGEAEAKAKLEAARQAEQAGDIETAADLEDQAISARQDAEATASAKRAEAMLAPAAIRVPARTAASGISTSTTWKAEVTDLMALVKAIAAGEPGASIELIAANTTEINRRAKALKKEFVVAGIRTWPDQNLAARRA